MGSDRIKKPFAEDEELMKSIEEDCKKIIEREEVFSVHYSMQGRYFLENMLDNEKLEEYNSEVEEKMNNLVGLTDEQRALVEDIINIGRHAIIMSFKKSFEMGAKCTLEETALWLHKAIEHKNKYFR